MSAVELFCGAGGMSLGFEQAGFDVLAAADLDPVHLAAHTHNFPLCEPVCDDVSTLDRADVLSAARRGWTRRHPDTELVGRVDCVFGGPSCQGFSVIGCQDPDDPRNALVNEFARVVEDLRPRWFVLENVPGLVFPKYRSALEDLYSKLRAAGYQIADPWLLDARSYGVPQERKRVFVVGARKGERLPMKPSPNAVAVSVAEALDDLAGLGRFRRLYEVDRLDLTDRQVGAIRQRQSEYVLQINGMAKDECDFSQARLWNPARLSSVGLTCHSQDVVTRFAQVRPGERDEVGRLPRLDPCGQSPTLRAGTGRDHGSFTSARPLHHRRPRVITVREAARLHGFPDWFGFHATKWHGFRQVGNAVPPPLARSVASSIIAAAGVRPLRPRGRLPLGSDRLLEMPMAESAEHFGLNPSQLPVDVRRNGSSKAKEAA